MFASVIRCANSEHGNLFRGVAFLHLTTWLCLFPTPPFRALTVVLSLPILPHQPDRQVLLLCLVFFIGVCCGMDCSGAPLPCLQPRHWWLAVWLAGFQCCLPLFSTTIKKNCKVGVDKQVLSSDHRWISAWRWSPIGSTSSAFFLSLFPSELRSSASGIFLLNAVVHASCP